MYVVKNSEITDPEERKMNKLYQMEKAIADMDSNLLSTDWSMLFEDTNLSVVLIEAKAKVLDAKKKFEKIRVSILRELSVNTDD